MSSDRCRSLVICQVSYLHLAEKKCVSLKPNQALVNYFYIL